MASLQMIARDLTIGHSKHKSADHQVEALASSAVRAADKLHARLMIVFTSTGRTARIIAKWVPQQSTGCQHETAPLIL